MTGSKYLLGHCVLLFLLAAPAFAQLPNGTAAGPDASHSATAPGPDDAAPEPEASVPASAASRPPQLEIAIQGTSGPADKPHLEAVQVTYGGELTLNADTADADLAVKQYDLRGHVQVHEADTTLKAGEVTLGGPSQSATALNALLTRGEFSIRAPRIVGALEPAASDSAVSPLSGKSTDYYLITAYNGDFTTVPNGGPADYHLRAETITLDSQAHRGTLRHVTVYLFGTRLVTLRRLSFGLSQSGGPNQNHLVIPTVGVSSRYGTFIAFGSTTRISRLPVQYRLLLPTQQSVEGSLTSFQTLYTPRLHPAPAGPYTGPVTRLEKIRAAATVPIGPLPEGDPLRFQDFLPDPNPIQLFNAPSHGGLYLGENLSVHVAASGNRRDDLYVSRLPEVTFSGDVPLSPVPNAPVAGDPQSFRAALRHVVLYAQAQETVGDYREQLTASPSSIRARREYSQIGLNTRPLLIAANTVLLPTISITSSSYSGSKSAYRYDQVNIAVNHYFSDLTAVGIQFLASSASGSSPFNFDVLDTDRELDLRFQTGNNRLVTAGRIRYDLTRGGVIDYQAALGPSLRGFIPVVTYNFRSRSFGLGLQVKGLTF